MAESRRNLFNPFVKETDMLPEGNRGHTGS